MMPSTDVKAGMLTTLLSNDTMRVPEAMPPRATPIGRPMATTDPKAAMRMKMANATPRTSD